jgi:2-pyrone-4,6-dicarboxylate lactonase
MPNNFPPTVACFDPDLLAPRWSAGPGAWDTHAHVFGPSADFPYAAGRDYTPPDATPDDYLRMLDALGIERAVLVQASCYGTDNRRLVTAVAAHPDRFVGVVDLDLRTTTDDELAGMPGVRGLRLRWPAAADRLDVTLARVATLGWHLDVLLDHIGSAPALLERVSRSGVRVVVEAMGSPRLTDAVGDPAFTALRDWLAAGRGWVKLSHPYAIDGPGRLFPHAARFARALVEAAPGRCLWGSDWPHPMMRGPVPNDTNLFDLLPDWTGGIEAARAVLVDNPQACYGLPASLPAKGDDHGDPGRGRVRADP